MSHPGDSDDDDTGDELVGKVLAGRYRIESLLGTGGMGAVYRAEHVHMRKAVAVKVLHREMTQMPEVVARFEREAVAAARIEHPHVAAATDFGRLEDGSFYLVLEFIEGRSLAARLKAEGAVPEATALKIAQQIADALATAHAAGVIHRDLKPDNVMLVDREGKSDFVKVLDFGIAKVKLEASSDQPLTQMGMVFGTPEYMSPEQARGIDVDARSDLYTLGLILHEMLSGASPFRHQDLVVVLTRQITMDPPPLPESVSRPAAELVSGLLRKTREERPQSAAEVRDRIDTILRMPASELERDHQLDATTTKREVTAGGDVDASAVVSPPRSPPPNGSGRTELSLALVGRHPLQTARGLIQRFRLGDLSQRLGLERRLVFGRYALPLGAALGLSVLLAVVLGLSLTLIAVSGGTTDPGQTHVVAPPPPPEDPDLLVVVAKAEKGDPSALAELSERAPAKRSLVEWRALGHGYCLGGELKTCLRVYGDAVAAHRELATDDDLIGDVRRIADHPELWSEALDFAAKSLGTAGADLIFDVWEKSKGSSSSTMGQRARALLDQEPVRSQMSRALGALLSLQLAMKRPKCPELKRLLPAMIRDADERVLPILSRLTDRRGCGFLGLSDCYGCLRSGGDLTRAMEAAKSRAKPSFRPASLPVPSVTAPRR